MFAQFSPICRYAADRIELKFDDPTHYGPDHRSTTAQDFVGVMSAVPLSLPSYYIQIKEPQSITSGLSEVQADTSGVDWSEMKVGKIQIFQSIADVNDVIFILF